MIFRTTDGQSFDTEKDLRSEERHVLQKLFGWEAMAASLDQFREKKRDALQRGWNNSGPVEESDALKAIIRELESRLRNRLRA